MVLYRHQSHCFLKDRSQGQETMEERLFCGSIIVTYTGVAGSQRRESTTQWYFPCQRRTVYCGRFQKGSLEAP